MRLCSLIWISDAGALEPGTGLERERETVGIGSRVERERETELGAGWRELERVCHGAGEGEQGLTRCGASPGHRFHSLTGPGHMGAG